MSSPRSASDRDAPVHLVVVGDSLLDRDVVGSVARICSDAPVPVVEETARVERPGGAGLAAAMARRDGVAVTLVTALAGDPEAARLAALLTDLGVDVVDCGDGGSTVEKVRIRADGQSLIRHDRGDGAVVRGLPAGSPFADADAVLVSDYGHGMAADRSMRAALADAVARAVPVVWDPHPTGPQPVPGIFLATPNDTEACRLSDVAAGTGPGDLTATIARARDLRNRWRCAAMCVTRGASGAVLVAGDGAPLVVPAPAALTGADTCGAGDVFAGAVAVALGRRSVLSEAVRAGVERAHAILAAGGATNGGSTAERPARRIVATGGCFDVIHPGHVALLEQARALGDRLVVLLNSDASVRRLKGEGRPVNRAVDRATVLRSMHCVDDVVVFDDDVPTVALRRLRPAVFVKGGDYTDQTLPETAVLAEWGGSVVTVPFTTGHSTTDLLRRAGHQEALDVG